MDLRCVICGAATLPDGVERARVRSNVRRFTNETFEVWRCPGCRSLHAGEDVDLAHYYEAYPFHGAALDLKVRAVYGSFLRRLRRHGLARSHDVLDYGCGSGNLVRYLRTRGYDRATGYDAYSAEFRDEAALARRYDVVLTQDVIEHVADPCALLATLAGLAAPGGLVVVGTPNAAKIDLARAEEHVFALHQPYHRHILARPALEAAGARVGLSVERVYDSAYTNTPIPFLNERFALFYLGTVGGVLDAAFEPVRPSFALFTPRAALYALFGFFLSPGTDMTVMFRAPASA
jgi:2-polyprenyl-3-methyl-5-hydroxy-6-metoxy-1,4-benzoquinol methylase